MYDASNYDKPLENEIDSKLGAQVTKTAKIVYLYKNNVKRADIARKLEISQQFVRNVLIAKKLI